MTAVEKLVVRVIMRDMETGAVESTETIDYNDRDDRAWLDRRCLWAFRNGRSVETFNKSDLLVATSHPVKVA